MFSSKSASQSDTTASNTVSASAPRDFFDAKSGSLRERVIDHFPSMRAPFSVSAGAEIVSGAELLTAQVASKLSPEAVGFQFKYSTLGAVERDDYVGHPIRISSKTISLAPSRSAAITAIEDPSFPKQLRELHLSTILLKSEDLVKAQEIVQQLAQDLGCDLKFGSKACTQITNVYSLRYPSREIHFVSGPTWDDMQLREKFSTFSFLLTPTDVQAVYSRQNAREIAGFWKEKCESPECIAALSKAAKELSRLGASAETLYLTQHHAELQKIALAKEQQAAIDQNAYQKLIAIPDLLTQIAPWQAEYVKGGIEFTLEKFPMSALSPKFVAGNKSTRAVEAELVSYIQHKFEEALGLGSQLEVRTDTSMDLMEQLLSHHEDIPYGDRARETSVQIKIPYVAINALSSEKVALIPGQLRELVGAK